MMTCQVFTSIGAVFLATVLARFLFSSRAKMLVVNLSKQWRSQ